MLSSLPSLFPAIKKQNDKILQERKQDKKSTLRLVRKQTSSDSCMSNASDQVVYFSLETTCTVIQMIPIPICLINTSGAILHRNNCFNSILGKDVNNVFESINGKDADRFYSGLKAVSAEEQVSFDVEDCRTKILNNKGDVLTGHYTWTISQEIRNTFLLVTIHRSSDVAVTHLEENIAKKPSKKSSRAANKMFCAAARGGGDEEIHRTVSEIEWDVFHEKVVAKKNKGILQYQTAQMEAKILSSTLEAKRVFVRHVGHEVRTPLNVVMTGFSLLRQYESKMPFQVLETLQDMHSACGAAVDVLNDLVMYESADSNILVLHKAPCDLVPLVQTAVQSFLMHAAQEEIRLDLVLGDTAGSALVEVDSSKIATVLRNVLSNAFKFTPRGGSVRLHVSVGEDAQRVRVEAHDSSPGLTSEDRARLLGQQQAPGTAVGKELQGGQGSGLGLILSRRLVDLHEGVFVVDTDWEGAGSKVYFELPLMQGADRSSQANLVPVVESATSLSPGKTTQLKLLFVDDVALCRKMNIKVLARSMSAHAEAPNGKEAVALVKESIESGRPFDGILMDSSMPIMDGTTATRLIREMGYTGKIFGVTGNALQSDIDDFLAHGADEVFIKPIKPEHFTHILEALTITTGGL